MNTTTGTRFMQSYVSCVYNCSVPSLTSDHLTFTEKSIPITNEFTQYKKKLPPNSTSTTAAKKKPGLNSKEPKQTSTTMSSSLLYKQYMAPISPTSYPHLTILLLSIGVFLTAWFFVYEVTSTKFTRSLKKELSISFVAAIFTGCGLLFLLLWVGIYV
ncbi:uncharacterized protein LOC126840241 [Adelges cooleyi]|uniref:uncharacterized protein LOC126840241 n=1 Tax=Adelges cooleyi TaxID=133065 RepID=UPI00218050BC|nr:uncharacterized protein LOC126840241 [Adelges cooleyi]